MKRARTSLARQMLAGSLLLTLSLAPLVPAFAHPMAMDHCQPACATVAAGRTPSLPCHAGGMPGCTHALTCALAPAAVLPASLRMWLPQGRQAPPPALSLARLKDVGFKPPTPPPNR